MDELDVLEEMDDWDDEFPVLRAPGPAYEASRSGRREPSRSLALAGYEVPGERSGGQFSELVERGGVARPRA